MTYSVDLRRHVLSVKKKEGLTFEQTAERFAVGIASLTRWNKTIFPKATRENRPRKVGLKALVKDAETQMHTNTGFAFWCSPKVALEWAAQPQCDI